jgi:hypothetical protein
MRSTDLDNVLRLRGLHRNRIAQHLQGRHKPLPHVDDCRGAGNAKALHVAAHT